ncbi:MAG: hypothetical protein HLUCCA04_03350 [Oceanicaulis sp. HLUCCA04]|nr:MAG: hypothetical protein HLUCCA04_03350 [Oceanicaulis sp. HLUCCA04]
MQLVYVVTGSTTRFTLLGFLFSLLIYLGAGAAMTIAGLAVVGMFPESVRADWFGDESWMVTWREPTSQELAEMYAFPILGAVFAMIGCRIARRNLLIPTIIVVVVPVGIVGTTWMLANHSTEESGNSIIAVLLAIIYFLRLWYERASKWYE